MKRLIVLLIVIAALVPWIDADAGQVGVPMTQRIPQHGHNNPADGGIINVPSFRAYRSGSQSVTCAADTKISFNAESWDTNNFYDSTTNYRFQPQQSGRYLINANVGSAAATATNTLIWIYRNGVVYSVISCWPYNGNNTYCNISDIVTLNGTTDYVEIFGRVSGASTCSFVGTTTETSFRAIQISR